MSRPKVVLCGHCHNPQPIHDPDCPNKPETRAVLDQMVADAEEDDLYRRTDGPAPTTRLTRQAIP
jgi:hypothetical protein